MDLSLFFIFLFCFLDLHSLLRALPTPFDRWPLLLTKKHAVDSKSNEMAIVDLEQVIFLPRACLPNYESGY